MMNCSQPGFIFYVLKPQLLGRNLINLLNYVVLSVVSTTQYLAFVLLYIKFKTASTNASSDIYSILD